MNHATNPFAERIDPVVLMSVLATEFGDTQEPVQFVAEICPKGSTITVAELAAVAFRNWMLQRTKPSDRVTEKAPAFGGPHYCGVCSVDVPAGNQLCSNCERVIYGPGSEWVRLLNDIFAECRIRPTWTNRFAVFSYLAEKHTAEPWPEDLSDELADAVADMGADLEREGDHVPPGRAGLLEELSNRVSEINAVVLSLDETEIIVEAPVGRHWIAGNCHQIAESNKRDLAKPGRTLPQLLAAVLERIEKGPEVCAKPCGYWERVGWPYDCKAEVSK